MIEFIGDGGGKGNGRVKKGQGPMEGDARMGEGGSGCAVDLMLDAMEK